MSEFIEWLEDLNEKDTKVRAVLRRSLAFAPGKCFKAFPYVEPFVKDEGNSWRRETHYLVAGLWASHWSEGRIGMPIGIGEACAKYRDESNSSSIERRFINLLDSDREQLAHRLRQMVALLKKHNLDFSMMLWDEDKKVGLLSWNDEQKRTQTEWARDFYRN